MSSQPKIYNVDALIVRGLATATPTATAYTPSPTPSRTNTPIPPSTNTFTPTATNAPTVTPTPKPSEPAPQALTGAQYAYDGDGTMMHGTVNGLTTFYPGRHYNKEVSSGATKIQKFYFAGTITIAVRTLTLTERYAADTADTLTWVLGDHLGSASTTANENGTLNSVIQYTAFGEIRLTQGLTPTKYRYTGQLAQTELGLDFYVSRWFDPALGHFVQADTIIPEPGKASTFDRYAYTLNNPIKYNDPTGQCNEFSYNPCKPYRPNYIATYVDEQIKNYGIKVVGGAFIERKHLLIALNNMDQSLGGIKRYTNGTVYTFTFDPQKYGGLTDPTTGNITFHSWTGGLPIQNIYHEIAHSMNIKNNYFSSYLNANKVYTDDGRFVMGGASNVYQRNSLGYNQNTKHPGKILDPTGTWVDAQQHPGDYPCAAGDSWCTTGNSSDEEFADLIANYISGNFDSSPYGIARINWVDEALYNNNNFLNQR